MTPIWLSSLPDAQTKARALKRPLLIDFWDPECLGCRKMLDITFPDAEVAEVLGNEFVCLKVNTAAIAESARPLVREQRVLWTPDLLFRDPTGAELGRRLGYHPPPDFVAVLLIVLGQTAMTFRDYGRALACFSEAADMPNGQAMRPEALFWAGIAAYKVGKGDRAVLRERWTVIRDSYHDTPWWTRAEASWGIESAPVRA
jgi:thioredoxin-related protein